MRFFKQNKLTCAIINALIKSSKEPQVQLVTIGDEISGYRVIEITEKAVILTKGDKKGSSVLRVSKVNKL